MPDFEDDAGNFRPSLAAAVQTVALCAIADAIKEQTAEFRLLRIALSAGNRAEFDTPGRAVYPFCDVCQCHHHPENDHCILRGGRGAEAMFPPTVRESREDNFADAAAALVDAFQKVGPGPDAIGDIDPKSTFAVPEPKS